MTPNRLTAALIALLLLLLFLTIVDRVAAPASQQQPGKITFVANLDGNWDVFVMDSDGDHSVQVTTTSVDERFPSLSPDRTKIVYGTTDGQLWIADLSSHQSTPLPLAKGQYYHPQWTADGKSIVFTTYEFIPGREDADIWIYTPDAKEAIPLLAQTGVQDYPSLSPKGDWLLYVSSLKVSLFGFGQDNLQQFWIAGLSDGAIKQLPLPSGRHTQPRWEPNGRRIAFSSDMGGASHIWLAKADGTELRQLTQNPGNGTSPAWSPDSSQIVFVSTRSGRMELWTIDLDSKEIRKLAPFGDRAIEAKDPDWR